MAIDGLISLLVEAVKAHESTRTLKPACHELQAAFLGLEMTIESELDQETASDRPVLQQRVAKPALAYGHAREKALNVFWELVRSCNDDRLEDGEQQRARQLVDQILEPYRRLTSFLASYPGGTLEHDVCKLLLTGHPADYGLARTRWSVRTLAKVCQEHLGTKAASKSQVGRFYKQLDWHKPVTRKLLSPDPLFGEKMKTLGMIMASLKPGDLLLFGDEFKFTSKKIQEHVIPTHAPGGLRLRLKEGPDSYYGPACGIDITGLYDPRTKYLETAELSSSDFQGYLPTFTSLIQDFLPRVTSKLYIVIDNGSIHRPAVLQNCLREIFDEQVTCVFLPTYSPNSNPIERVWQQLLNTVMRTCNTREELRIALQIALAEQRRASQEQKPAPLKLCCPVCHHEFVFKEIFNLELFKQVEKHLCFNIPHLNPYTIQILTHSLEVFPLGHFDQV
jgi:transposase